MGEQPTPQQPNRMLQSMSNLAPVRSITTFAHEVNLGWEDAKERFAQFREDYAEGGGIRYGLRRAFRDGFYGALVTGFAGAGLGLGIPVGLDLLNAAANPVPPNAIPMPNAPDTSLTDAWFPALSIYLGIGGGVVGGVIFFFEGLTAPAREGARYRRGNYWEDYYR